MHLEWDDAKDARCRRERGFSFADVAPALADPARLVETDDRRDYGEIRRRCIGAVDGRIVTIVFTTRDATIRIISARRANRAERNRYGQSTP